MIEPIPGPEHCNGSGIVHGGFLASVDTTTEWAVRACMPVGTTAPHVQLSVQYLRAAVPGT